jgi:hypothetical protein
MALIYVKHNRTVTTHDITKYGQLATHDIQCPCLLLYELGKIKDKNGTEVDINKEFIDFTMTETNDWIKKRHSSPFAKDIEQWSHPLDEVLAIPVIKNHKTDEVENQSGNSKGLLYTENVDGIYSLFTDVLIKDIKAKQDIENGLLRAISIGTRPAGSIKEISFVINEAAPLCGLMFGEQTLIDRVLLRKQPMTISLPKSGIQLPEVVTAVEPKEPATGLELAEEIKGLQLAEHELANVIIPNHIVLSRMIAGGKLIPWRYDELIKAEPKMVELMEKSIPATDLGLMFGTNKQPQKINVDELKFNEQLENSKKKLGIKTEAKQPTVVTEMIKQNVSSAEVRAKELKYILELAEYSPDVVAKYIKHELGEDVEKPKYSSILLSEYVNQLKQVKSKLIELGE